MPQNSSPSEIQNLTEPNEALKQFEEESVKILHGMSDTTSLVEALIDVVNKAIEIVNPDNSGGRVFRIGVTNLDEKGILVPIRVVRKKALKESMYLDTFFLLPLKETSLKEIVMNRQGDYINDMEEHLSRRLASGRSSLSSQICLKEGIMANMRFHYRTRKNIGFIFFSGDKKGMFNKEVFDFTNKLIEPFQSSLEICNDLDAIIEAPKMLIKEKGSATESFELFHRIQAKLEPDSPFIPVKSDVQVFHRCFPWKGHPSGDLLNIWEMDDGRLGVVIADVTGHGIISAKITVFLRGLFLREGKVGDSPKEVMERVDWQLKRYMDEKLTNSDEFFATSVFGILDPVAGEFVYCSAGHLAQFGNRGGSAEDRIIELESSSLALGMPFEKSFKETRLKLSRGDSLVLFTDGFTELANGTGEFFGISRLKNLIAENREKTAEEIGETILSAAEKYAAPETFTDDASLLVLKIPE